jgi:hypothetical protein
MARGHDTHLDRREKERRGSQRTEDLRAPREYTEGFYIQIGIVLFHLQNRACMARSSQASRSVFVGNIPYSATEEQLEDIFRTVGHVVNFRSVFVNPCCAASSCCMREPAASHG